MVDASQCVPSHLHAQVVATRTVMRDKPAGIRVQLRPGSVLGENEDSSRSSTASSCSSSNHGDSAWGTPQHLQELSNALLPRCGRTCSRLLRPLTRSKSSDIGRLTSSASSSTLTSTATIVYSTNGALREHVATKGNKQPNSGTRSAALIETIDNSMKPSSSVTISPFDKSSDHHEVNHPKRSFMAGKGVQKLCRVFRKSDSMNFPVSSKSDFLQINQKTKVLNMLLSSTGQPSSDSPKGGRHLDSPRDADSPPTFPELPAALGTLKAGLHSTGLNGGLNGQQELQSPENDTRPTGDYDSPWDMNRRLSQVVTEIINTPKSEAMPYGFPCEPSTAGTAMNTSSARPASTPGSEGTSARTPTQSHQVGQLKTPTEGRSIFSIFSKEKSITSAASPGQEPSNGRLKSVECTHGEPKVQQPAPRPHLEPLPLKPRNFFLAGEGK